MVFDEMSSWTALTCYLDNILWITNFFGLLLWRFKILRVIEENACLKQYIPLQQGTHKLGFSATPILVCIFV